jgi:UDP-glucose 4-epimerase
VARASPAAVVHLAALHAPHVGRQPDADFWSINVEATAALLAAAAGAGATRFVFASTTSVYGAAMRPGPDATAAAWVDETLTPDPEDVYDATKLAAEALVAAAHHASATGRVGGLATLTLRIGRCFPEPPPVLAAHRLHRGVDLRDVVQAHRLALDVARSAGDGPLVANVAGPLVFTPDDRAELLTDAAAVVDRRVPGLRQAFARRGWSLPATVDRVYDSTRARHALGYAPVHDTWATLAP